MKYYNENSSDRSKEESWDTSKRFAAVSSSNLRIESLGCEIQGEYQRLSSVSRRNEDMLPGLFSEAQATSSKIKSVELSVQHRLAEMDNKLQRIMESGLNSSSKYG